MYTAQCCMTVSTGPAPAVHGSNNNTINSGFVCLEKSSVCGNLHHDCSSSSASKAASFTVTTKSCSRRD